MMTTVLFVCSGKICCSPMAEAVMRHKIAAADLSRAIAVDSAGTGSWHIGELPHRGTREVLRRHQIIADGIVARQVNRHDLDAFDYLVAMASEHEDELRDLLRQHGGRGQVVRLLDFADPAVTQGRRDVPDPYYTGEFDLVYQLVDAAVDGLLHHVQRG
jgi:protein-tyrosine phosphatase